MITGDFSVIWRWLISALIVLTIVESSAALICGLLSISSQTSRFFWKPNLEQARSNWESHSSAADKEIGGFISSGAKANEEFSNHGRSCGSAFGDSFVGGAEVPNGDGWVEQLSHLLGCRVDNYAVGGDGTDQAYLRFRKVYDGSPIVLLGIDPGAIMDIVNQYDGFLSPDFEPYQLKGRFIAETSDNLEWLPPPHLDASGFVAMHRNPANVLPHSYFLPDTSDGPVTLGFPFTVTLARVALLARVHNLLMRRTEWSGLYAADHPSGALRLMVAICEAVTQLTKANGGRPLIVMLPVAHSFREKANHGLFEYAPLITALQAKDIEVFDPGPAMLAALRGRSVCEFFTRPHKEMVLLTSPVPCGGHYSSFANTILAQLVAAELESRNFLKH